LFFVKYTTIISETMDSGSYDGLCRRQTKFFNSRHGIGVCLFAALPKAIEFMI